MSCAATISGVIKGRPKVNQLTRFEMRMLASMSAKAGWKRYITYQLLKCFTIHVNDPVSSAIFQLQEIRFVLLDAIFFRGIGLVLCRANLFRRVRYKSFLPTGKSIASTRSGSIACADGCSTSLRVTRIVAISTLATRVGTGFDIPISWNILPFDTPEAVAVGASARVRVDTPVDVWDAATVVLCVQNNVDSWHKRGCKAQSSEEAHVESRRSNTAIEKKRNVLMD